MTIDPTGMQVEDGAVHMLQNGDAQTPGQRPALSEDPRALATGRNSGYQALNLAVLAGARRILLLGYDMRIVDGRSHWFGDHPAPNFAHEFALYAKNFRALPEELERLGVEVLNCTLGSAVDAFPMASLEEALA